MQNQKGMSQIVLIISIVIITLATIYIVNIVKEQLNKKTVEDYETDMLMIQSKVKILDEEVNMKKDEIELEGKNILENLEQEKIKQILDKKLISQEEENFEKYYILENEDLEKIGLSNIKLKKGFYIVNYTTDEVIYSEGISDGKNIYYKLSEIKEIKNSKQDNENNNIANSNEQSEEQKTEISNSDLNETMVEE